MSLQSNNTYWSKTENAAGLITPETGPTGTIVSTMLFELVKFLNGTLGNTATDYVSYNRAAICPDAERYIFDCWFKFKIDSASWTTAQFFGADRVFGSKDGLGFGMAGGIESTKFQITIRNSGVDTTIFSSPQSWVVNELVHIMLILDKSTTFDGSKTLAVYWNGSEILSSAIAINFVTLNTEYRLFGIGVQGNQDYVVDNLKFYNSSQIVNFQEVLDNKNNEGFPVISKIIKPRFNTAKPRVFIFDEFNDIYEDVQELQAIEENKTFQKDKLIINEISLIVKNQNNKYSVDNPLSDFHGISWKFKPFKIFDKNNNLIWNGLIKDIPRDHGSKTAEIQSIDTLSQFQEEKVEYESSGFETPSQAALNILNNAGYPAANINTASFNSSSNLYNDNGVLILVNINKSDNSNLQLVLDKLGTIGFADLYMENNKINMVAWKKFTGGTKATLTEDDFIESPVISAPDENLINEYVISYAGDLEVPARDSTNSSPIGTLSRDPKRNGLHEFVLNGALDQQISIKDKVAADFIGRSYIERTHRDLLTNPSPLIMVEHSISINNENWLDLNTFNKISFKRENWINKDFEVFRINKDKSNKIIGLTEFEIAS